MARKTTFGDLERLLTAHGFEQVPARKPFVVFRHVTSGALQAFRPHRASEVADPMTLASVRKTLVGFSFLEEGAFEAAIQAAGARRQHRVDALERAAHGKMAKHRKAFPTTAQCLDLGRPILQHFHGFSRFFPDSREGQIPWRC